MNQADDSARSSLDDIANSRQLAELTGLLEALRDWVGSSLRALPGGEHGPAARQLRSQTRSLPTSALRASVQQGLRLLDMRPWVDPQVWVASRQRLSAITSQRAIEDDWVARLAERRRRLDTAGDRAGAKMRDAELKARRQQLQRLMDRERHAERIVEEHERRWQAVCDWHLKHRLQLVQARWQALELLERQERALDELAAAPPPYVLDELGAPPRAPQPRDAWRHGALAILRYRKDHDIQDVHRALGERSGAVAQRLRRGQVEVVIDLARQLIHRPSDEVQLSGRSNAPEVDGP
jgi:hypothetical protein